jgi:hypothetical protein
MKGIDAMEKREAIQLVCNLIVASLDDFQAVNRGGGKKIAAQKKAAAVTAILSKLTQETITKEDLDMALGW